MKKVLGIVLAAVILGGYVWFGKIQDEVITFNDTVIDLLEEEERIFTDYVRFLEKYHASEMIDVGQMNAALDSLSAKHQSVSSRMKQVSVPDYDVCREFYASVLAFLENDARIITAYSGINKHVETSNPGTPADVDEISVMLESLLAENDSIFNAIVLAQKNMSDKFMFRLE